MENGIEKFDPSKLMDGVKDRIKATFVSLIPDEMWNAMAEKEIYVFTTGKIIQHHEYEGRDENDNPVYRDWEERIPYTDEDIRDNWGNVKVPAELSPLRQMIRDELRKKFHEDLVSYLNGEQYTAVRDQYGIKVISKAVEDIMVDNASTLFRSVIGDFLQRGFENMRVQVAMQSGQY